MSLKELKMTFAGESVMNGFLYLLLFPPQRIKSLLGNIKKILTLKQQNFLMLSIHKSVQDSCTERKKNRLTPISSYGV